MKNRVRAVVRVTMDVTTDSVWGGECTFDQIAKQAEDNVRGLFQGNALTLKELPHRVRNLSIQEVVVSKVEE